jgi:hypothetical protein
MHKKTQSLKVQTKIVPPALTSFDDDLTVKNIWNKMTIQAFLREKDSKILSLQKNGMLSHNRTNTLSDKSPKKMKGTLLVNELWSYDYYKKVIKCSKLEESMNMLKKKNEINVCEQKSALLKKKENDFKVFNIEINNLNSLSPFALRNLNEGRRNAFNR